jgi:hypothetical protein
VKLEKLIGKFEGKQPEIVFAWKDSETEAEGWVVILCAAVLPVVERGCARDLISAK